MNYIKKRMTQVVLVEHETSSRRFMFQTEKELRKGDVVRCDTLQGNSIGTVVMDSGWVDEDALAMMKDLTGAGELKHVTGVYVLRPIYHQEETDVEQAGRSEADPRGYENDTADDWHEG
ncbi:MAG: hypothetical protein VB031_02290 [Eubacteriaceae bacterium]|nr:hypothetical protein [Eubacteriaceae bacterium]